MYAFKRVLVGLDMTIMDDLLIEYTAYISKLFEIEKVYFLHIAKDLDLPEEVKTKYPDLLAPVDERIEREITQKLEAVSFDCEYEVEAQEGDATEKMLRWTKVKEIDLIIMGKKFGLKGQGVLSGKIAKLALCSILSIPEGAEVNISQILVPTDFSDTSKMALRKAIEIAHDFKAKVILQNSFDVPHGYSKTGKSFEEFSEIMRENAKSDLQAFLKDVDARGLELPCTFSQDEEHEPDERAYEVASEKKANLIVIGSRGRTNVASMLLGSMAEKMTLKSSRIPLLIIKKKDTNLSFFEALFNI